MMGDVGESCVYHEPSWFEKMMWEIKRQWQELKYVLRIEKRPDSNMMWFAKNELAAIGMMDGDPYNEMMVKHILHMVKEFSDEGHSGFSASYATNVLNKLLRFEPLCPLTGEDSEWHDVSEYSGDPANGKLYQNKRCSHVFKDNTGAWDINGKYFMTPDGATYTSKESHVPVTFPYTPTSVCVQVDE